MKKPTKRPTAFNTVIVERDPLAEVKSYRRFMCERNESMKKPTKRKPKAFSAKRVARLAWKLEGGKRVLNAADMAEAMACVCAVVWAERLCAENYVAYGADFTEFCKHSLKRKRKAMLAAGIIEE